MRGKVIIEGLAKKTPRITPAYAGKRGRSGVAPKAVEDHPRLCGEKLSAEPDKHHRRGSPPPMRGKVE